jgi:GNAT superfamily N-acetyltransferase
VISVRPREDRDLLACASLLVAVHEEDGYPVNMPEDPVSFFVVPDLLGAWVAVDSEPGAESDVIGHVLLRAATSPTVMEVAADATGLRMEGLAVVGRLLVDPAARRRGAGRSLLSRAAAAAWKLGRQPVLDVVTGHEGAVALYEREGWRMAGSVQITWRSGETVDELVFIGPAGAAA